MISLDFVSSAWYVGIGLAIFSVGGATLAFKEIEKKIEKIEIVGWGLKQLLGWFMMGWAVLSVIGWWMV